MHPKLASCLVALLALFAILGVHCGGDAGNVTDNVTLPDGSADSTSAGNPDGSSTDDGSSTGDGGTDNDTGNGTEDAEPLTFAVSGTITGLTGTGLVLENNSGDDLTIPANATTFTFVSRLTPGSSYAVTVTSQPSNPPQICTVTAGTGTITANVTNVSIACVVSSYQICPTVSGLAASTGDAGVSDTGAGELILQNNVGDGGTGDSQTVATNGAHCFPAKITTGGTYDVTVVNPQNPYQTCTVSGGTGTVMVADVTSIAVNCSVNTFTLGGTVTGLLGTVVLTAQDGQGAPLQDVQVTSTNATYSFMTPLPSGQAYNGVV
jgi:hypothetical protein